MFPPKLIQNIGLKYISRGFVASSVGKFLANAILVVWIHSFGCISLNPLHDLFKTSFSASLFDGDNYKTDDSLTEKQIRYYKQQYV